jgi:hypothetical protein
MPKLNPRSNFCLDGRFHRNEWMSVFLDRQYDKKKNEYQTQEKSDLQAELTLTKSEVHAQ